jgi:hypothetical protein
LEILNPLLALLGGGLMIWLLYRAIRQSPETFSKDNMSKSLGTLGVLALILIGFVGLFVILLKK